MLNEADWRIERDAGVWHHDVIAALGFQRDLRAKLLRQLTRPRASGDDHHVGVDAALVGDHRTRAIGADVEIAHGLDQQTALALDE